MRMGEETMALRKMSAAGSSPLRKRQVRSFAGKGSCRRRLMTQHFGSFQARAGPGGMHRGTAGYGRTVSYGNSAGFGRNGGGDYDTYTLQDYGGYETQLPVETLRQLTPGERKQFERLSPDKKNALIQKAWQKANSSYGQQKSSHPSEWETPFLDGFSYPYCPASTGFAEIGYQTVKTGNRGYPADPVTRARSGAGALSATGNHEAAKKEAVQAFYSNKARLKQQANQQVNRGTADSIGSALVWNSGGSLNGSTGYLPDMSAGHLSGGIKLGVQTGNRQGRNQKGYSTGSKSAKKRSFTRYVRRSLLKMAGRERAKEQQVQEAKEQWELEAEQKDQLKSALSGGLKGAKKLTAILFENIETIRGKIIQGKALKILFVLPIAVFVILLLCFFMSMVTITTQEEPTFSVAGSEIVAYAKEWIGITKYIYGAGRMSETDWQDYADCSSFVHGVFSHFGYEIGGDTISMEDSGTLITSNSIEGALPGDIVLFYSGGIGPAQSTHVGIYAGNGEMVHCSGGRMNVSPETAGRGVCMGSVLGDGRAWEIRRIVPEGGGGVGSGGHRVDPSKYSMSDMELIWAIVAQEDNGSYEGALAVISCAMNRTESPAWGYLGSTAMQQLTAPGQFCYSMDHYWEARLSGNVPEYVKQAVSDCLEKGIRNHSFTSFRSTKGKTTGDDAVQIGGNWFFGN